LFHFETFPLYRHFTFVVRLREIPDDKFIDPQTLAPEGLDL